MELGTDEALRCELLDQQDKKDINMELNKWRKNRLSRRLLY